MKKLSARNQLVGKVVEVRKGQTTSHVKIDIGNGILVTSSITNEAVDDLSIAKGDEVIAVIKASDVGSEVDTRHRHRCRHMCVGLDGWCRF